MDKDKEIRAIAVVKSILESPWTGSMILESGSSVLEGKALEILFERCIKIIENYIGKTLEQEHLSDEQIARELEKRTGIPVDALGSSVTGNLAPNIRQIIEQVKESMNTAPSRYTSSTGKTFAYCSEKQGKRAYAIQKANGWEDYQVRSLAQRFGFQNTKKIPVGVYDAFIRELEKGPRIDTSSSHLEIADTIERDLAE